MLLIATVVADRTSHHQGIVHWRAAYHWALTTAWDAGAIRVISGILILVGLVLLIAELKPTRVSRLAADRAEAGLMGLTLPIPAGASRPPSGPRSPRLTACGAPR